MQECGWLTVDILTMMTQWNTVSWGQTGPGRELRSLNSPSRASYSKAVMGIETRSWRPELQNCASRKAKPVNERQQDRQTNKQTTIPSKPILQSQYQKSQKHWKCEHLYWGWRIPHYMLGPFPFNPKELLLSPSLWILPNFLNLFFFFAIPINQPH